MHHKKTHDEIGRRSRFRRSPTGKPVMLTERDIAILGWLYRYRFLRAPQLINLLNPKSKKRFIERLGDLYHETGLIDRPLAQWRRFDARYQPLVYELSAKGVAYLSAHEALPERAVTFSKRRGDRHRQSPQFDHAMMITDTLVAVELATRQAKDQRFVAVDEILNRRPGAAQAGRHPLAVPVIVQPNDGLAIKTPTKITIVPDALYGIGYRQNGRWLYRFYALECENWSPRSRSTAKHSSLRLKRAAYDALHQSGAYRDAWNIPCLELQVIERQEQNQPWLTSIR